MWFLKPLFHNVTIPRPINGNLTSCQDTHKKVTRYAIQILRMKYPCALRDFDEKHDRAHLHTRPYKVHNGLPLIAISTQQDFPRVQ